MATGEPVPSPLRIEVRRSEITRCRRDDGVGHIRRELAGATRARRIDDACLLR